MGGQPALLTHDDVHHAVPRVRPRPAPHADAGRRARRSRASRGVEWDAVELPSQFMENFCWEWEVLQRLTGARRHRRAAAARAVRQACSRRSNFQSGLQMLRQVEFALFDMRLHAEPDAAAPRCSRSLDEVRRRGRGAAAARRSTASAQLHAHLRRRLRGRLLQLQVGRGAVGRRLRAPSRKPALFDADDRARASARRSSKPAAAAPAMESFVAFRGREPRIDALLRHQGLA
ncbi:MAG: M3 family metallopeptidase [Comamonadaceae bacterium]|nr:M3 family metallopeptidase [Comamonadaceae bacterium]